MPRNMMLEPCGSARCRFWRYRHGALLMLTALAAGVAIAAPDATTSTLRTTPAAPRPSAAARSAVVSESNAAALEDSRVKMQKWFETQQVLAKERADWDEDKKILGSRVELARNEIRDLETKIAEVRGKQGTVSGEQNELLGEKQALEQANAQLGERVAGLEAKLHRIAARLPEHLKTKLQPLIQRVPVDPAAAKISVTERYQNVLGIMNEINKANNEIAVINEVHTMADGKPAEVKAIYVGLGQAYFISARGEAGMGHPTDAGWTWEAVPGSAKDILTALEIIEGKHIPGFVPLPVKVQ